MEIVSFATYCRHSDHTLATNFGSLGYRFSLWRDWNIEAIAI